MKPTILWTIKLGVLASMLVALAYAHYTIVGLRQEAAETQLQLRKKPDQIFYEAALEAELQRHQFDVERIEQYVPPREQIINVISRIEAEGQRQAVTVAISEIKEELVLDGEGKPVPVVGPLEDVAIELSATGEPVNLIQFLYGLDHLPYVVHVSSWHLAPDRTASRPPSLPPVAGQGAVQEARPPSRLEVTLKMASQKTNYEKTSASN